MAQSCLNLDDAIPRVLLCLQELNWKISPWIYKYTVDYIRSLSGKLKTTFHNNFNNTADKSTIAPPFVFCIRIRHSKSRPHPCYFPENLLNITVASESVSISSVMSAEKIVGYWWERMNPCTHNWILSKSLRMCNHISQSITCKCSHWIAQAIPHISRDRRPPLTDSPALLPVTAFQSLWKSLVRAEMKQRNFRLGSSARSLLPSVSHPLLLC